MIFSLMMKLQFLSKGYSMSYLLFLTLLVTQIICVRFILNELEIFRKEIREDLALESKKILMLSDDLSMIDKHASSAIANQWDLISKFIDQQKNKKNN